MNVSFLKFVGRFTRPSLLLRAGLACNCFAIGAQADAAGLGVGASFETLQVGATKYQHVQVRSVTPRTVMIMHDGGMASLRLRDLSPELQSQFGYDQAAEAAAEKTLTQAAVVTQAKRPADPRRNLSAAAASEDSRFDRVLQSFGRAPDIQTEVDLRPRFFELALGVKDQGFRPSCSVFAVVSALEFQNADLFGKTEKFSEEYLIWATGKTLNRSVPASTQASSAGGEEETAQERDAGFALSEVVNALRTYGIPAQTSMPNKFLQSMVISDPPADVIEEARSHRRVSIHAMPGRDQPTRIANIIQALNANMPIPIGVRWPHWRSMHGGLVDQQSPHDNDGHAITLVGYQNKTGAVQDTLFIFKNSWGARWGQGGYGHISYRYLTANLSEAVLLEVQRDGAK